jgi:ribosomal protein S14
MPFTLPEKLDIMLKEVEKRRNLYIATLQSRNRCSRFSRTRNFTLSRNDLRQMMSAWEDDYESWMHPEHWQGFHK